MNVSLSIYIRVTFSCPCYVFMNTVNAYVQLLESLWFTTKTYVSKEGRQLSYDVCILATTYQLVRIHPIEKCMLIVVCVFDGVGVYSFAVATSMPL